MKGTRHSEEQIIAILKQGEAGLRVRRVLDRIASERELPEAIVVDNGPEFRGGHWRPGANNAACAWSSFSQASPRRMPTSKASTADCATNV
jgi:hypothetical protein